MTGVIQLDPWLEPFRDALKHRFAKAQKWIKSIDETEGGLEKFSRGYENMGFTFSPNGDITYRYIATANWYDQVSNIIIVNGHQMPSKPTSSESSTIGTESLTR